MTESDRGTPNDPGQCRKEPHGRPCSMMSGAARPTPEEFHRLVHDLEASHQELAQLKSTAAILEQCATERTALADRRAKQLRVLASELTQAEQRERRRLAQVLHDDLQQHLVAIRLKVAALYRRTHDQEIIGGLQEVDAMLNESIDASRVLTYELSPPVLHDAGLNAALQWLGRWTREKHGLSVEVFTDQEAEPAEESLRILLFQIVRELLFNVVKHAQTPNACVEVTRRGDQVRIVVSDEGAGFDVTQLKASTLAHGFGLSSVRERLELMGGMLEIDAGPGRGTRITITVPRHIPRAETNGEPRLGL
jgi:signal transduction histidine kinase